MASASSPPNRALPAREAHLISCDPPIADQALRAKRLGKVAPRGERAVSEGKLVVGRASRMGREIAGVSQTQLALPLDTYQTVVAKWELDSSPFSPPTCKLADEDAPREWVRAIVAGIGSVHRLQVIDAPVIAHGDNNAARIVDVAAKSNDVVRVFASGLVSGRVSAATLADTQRATQAAISALLELDAYCAAELIAARKR